MDLRTPLLHSKPVIFGFRRSQRKNKINFKIQTVSFCQSSAVNFKNLIYNRVNSISVSIAAQYLHSISNLEFSLTSAKYTHTLLSEKQLLKAIIRLFSHRKANFQQSRWESVFK